MALIKCPACGDTVSENAASCPHCGEPIKASRMSGEFISGTESFHVEARNRLELSAKVDAEVTRRTAHLSSEGKNVINIVKSDPQPFTLGVTIWKMDVTLVWNASLDSSKYKETLYQQAKLFQSNGDYEKANSIYEKLGNFGDSSTQKSICQKQVEQIQKQKQQQAARSAAYTAERLKMEQSIGEDPMGTRAGWFRWIAGAILLFIGFISWFFGGVCSAGGVAENQGVFSFGMILFCTGAIFILWNIIGGKLYAKKEQEYHKAKLDALSSTINTTVKTEINTTKTNEAQWICDKCGASNIIGTYYCKSCKEQKDFLKAIGKK